MGEKMSQCEMVLYHLQNVGTITTATAFLEYGITRLASRICDLRKKGYKISSVTTSGKNRFGKVIYFSTYTLEEVA